MMLSALQREIVELRAELQGRGFFDPAQNSVPYPGISPETRFDLLVSRMVSHAAMDDEAVERWIDERRSSALLRAEIIPVLDAGHWQADAGTGVIGHDTGRFFTITGVSVRHRVRNVELEWDQPLIEQPEVGILGILAKRFDGVMHFYMQAKEEPGNIGVMQLSPTVQATWSNYSLMHGGTSPLFLDIFLNPPAGSIILSRLQSEDGGRFLFKSNLNMVIEAKDDIGVPAGDRFIWLTLRQLSRLMRRDNLVSYCARSVLSCLI